MSVEGTVLTPEIVDEETAGQLVIHTCTSTPKIVRNQDEYNRAMVDLTNIKLRIKQVEDFWETILAPMRKAKKAADERKAKMLEPLEGLKRALNDTAGQWFLAETRRKEEIQKKENAKYEEKVNKAIEAGKDTALVAPPKMVEQPIAKVQTQSGASTTMTLIDNWRVKAHPEVNQRLAKESKDGFYRSDPRLAGLPDSCWILDTARVNNLAKSGTCELLELYKVPSSNTRG